MKFGLKSRGFVLSKKNYSESDRIITVFSKDYGKTVFLAKSVRKPKSRKRGHLEIFSEIFFSAVDTSSMKIVTEVVTLDNFEKIRKDLSKVSLAYYFCEVINKITREDEPNKEIYGLLLIFFNRLQTEKKLKKLRLDFIYHLLTILGYWPRGKKLIDADLVLNDILEKTLYSVRVGKRVLV